MKKILIPTDFSDCSKNAALYAAHLFKDDKIEYHLVQSCAAVYPMPDGAYMPDSTAFDAAEEEMKKLKEWFSNELGEGSHNIHTYVEYGAINAVVNNIADKVKPDLIVMGTHGMTAASDTFFGSNTSNLILDCDYPIYAIPSHVKHTEIRNVLMASDLDELDDCDKLTSLFEIMRITEAELEIFKVYESETVEEDVDERYQLARLDDYFTSIKHHFSFEISDDPETAIMQHLDEGRFDMLVMFPRHKGALSRIFHKSVTKQMALKSWVPLLVIDPKE